MGPVFETPVAGPATHAIVIGVGAYLHLPGGQAFAQRLGVPWTVYPDHEGMGQLSSPPRSARAFARWLLAEYRNPERPLASLHLLLSEPEAGTITLGSGEVKPVERASFDNVKAAVKDWKSRGDQSAEHLLIFYFCGHGVNRGFITTLLLDDFGEDPGEPLEQAINLNGFHAGMDQCLARRQCFFIDACRVPSAALIERFEDYAGPAIIHGSAYLSEVPRYAPVFYSTVAGSAAYSREGEASLFTQALLRSLAGAGSKPDDEDNWLVYTGGTLHESIQFLLKRATEAVAGPSQVSSADHVEGEGFPLHYLPGRPIVPILVAVKPAEATGSAELSYALPDGSDPVVRPPGAASEWDVEIPEGRYRFKARFAGGPYHEIEEERTVFPPGRKVSLEVAE